jgi:hypothetical protein
VQFGPNAAGWSIVIRTALETTENYDFIVEINGPNGSISAGTFGGRNQLQQFGMELQAVFKSLSGTTSLRTDNFTMTVSTARTGSLHFAGSLVCYQFDQFPTGRIRVDFEQAFDPISIEAAANCSTPRAPSARRPPALCLCGTERGAADGNGTKQSHRDRPKRLGR